MIEIAGKTVDQVFVEAVARWPDNPLVIAPESDTAPVRMLSYADMDQAVTALSGALSAAGYGRGMRAAVLVGATPEHYMIKLALARIGMSCVPVNPDYTAAHYNLTLLYEETGRLEEARRHYEAFIAGGGSSPELNIKVQRRLERLSQ